MLRIDSYVRPSYDTVTPQAPFRATLGQKLLDAFKEKMNLTPKLLERRI